MISILIPVFNVAVYPLVRELSEQLKSLKTEGEILVYDDASNELFKAQNNSLSGVDKVFYKELDKNHGRIAIRKLLAENASYNWLLFIDCDSLIKSKDFLSNYLQQIEMGFEVYAGGTDYQSDPPAACIKRLHWKYGTERESAKGFHTNNFCIQKEVFLQLNFPMQISGYGHEDTWMEMELTKTGKKINYFDNPVLHDGLEDTPVFLNKTKNALKNLLRLATITDEGLLRQKINLFNLFYWQKKLRVNRVVTSVLKNKIINIEKNLNSCNPSILQFDLYRLYFLIEFDYEMAKQKQNGIN